MTPVIYKDPNGTFVCGGLCLAAAIYVLSALVIFIVAATETVDGGDIANNYANEPRFEIGNFSDCSKSACQNTTGVMLDFNYGIHQGEITDILRYKLFDVSFAGLLGYSPGNEPRLSLGSRIKLVEFYSEEKHVNLGVIDVTISGSINIGIGPDYDLLNKRTSFGIFGGSFDVSFN